MDKNEKLAIARKKLKKFQSKNSPQYTKNTSVLEPSPQSILFTAPTLTGPLPTASQTPFPQSLPPTTSSSSTSFFPASSPNGPSPSPSINNMQTMPEPSARHGTFAPTMDLIPPLTSSSAAQNSNYSLPNLASAKEDGRTSGSLSEPLLNGSILDHLTPTSGNLTQNMRHPVVVSDSQAVIPPHHYPKYYAKPLQVSAGLLSTGVTSSDGFRPITGSTGVTSSGGFRPITGSTGDTSSGGFRPTTGSSFTGVTSSDGVRPITGDTSSGDFRPTAGSFTGASQGGVLVRHIPYLPSSSPPNSLGVGLVEGRQGGVVEGEQGSGGVAFGIGDGGSKASSIDDEVTELEQKVKAHAQTIDILVGEKSTLQMELSSLKAQLATKSRESLDWEGHLKATRQKLTKLEKDTVTTSTELTRKTEELRRSKLEREELRKSLEHLRSSLEDQQEEGTELISKVAAQSAEIVQLQSINTDLQSKLTMSELLTQQLSGGKPAVTPPTDPTVLSQLKEAEDHMQQLKRNLEVVTRERDQVTSDLSVLRDSLLEQQEDSTKKLAECQMQLAESQALVSSMKKEMNEILVQKEVLERKLSTEHAHCEHFNPVAMEAVKQERDQLKLQLEKQVEDNVQLVKMNTEVENQALGAEMKLSRLEEQSVDHQSLLTTMAQDKETLSRAMSQNKELKHNIAELQDAFVKLSHQNMELASELDTERRRLSHIKEQMATPTKPAAQTTPTLGSGEDRVKDNDSGEGGNSSSVVVNTSILEKEREDEDRVKVKGDAVAAVVEEKQKLIEALILEKTWFQDKLEQLRAEHHTLQDKHHTLQDKHHTLQEEHHTLQDRHDYGLQDEHHTSQDRHGPTLRDEHKSLIQTATPTSETEVTPPLLTDSGTLLLEHTDGEALVTRKGEKIQEKIHPLSPQQLAEFQTSFNALQQKFVVLMREKADLLEKIEEHEVVIMKLASETDTAGDYMTQYQTQRDALNQFREKDHFIQQLMAEKAAMQTNIAQLQVLVRKVISEQSSRSSPHLSTRSKPRTHTTLTPHRPTSSLPLSPPLSASPYPSTPYDSNSSLPKMPPKNRNSSESGLPLHLRPPSPHYQDTPSDNDADLTVSSTILDLNSSHMTEEDSHVTTATAEQIMELLDQLEMTAGSDGGGLDGYCSDEGPVVHCNMCTGQVLVV